MKNTWFTYIIRCANGSLYTGSTNHVIRRWHQHRNGNGAKYFRAHRPELMEFVEVHPDRAAACRREYRIKQLSKKQKEALIRSKNS
ncbi:MAG: GIY-YIG nuclease family protein [Bacteroidota bacterium]